MVLLIVICIIALFLYPSVSTGLGAGAIIISFTAGLPPLTKSIYYYRINPQIDITKESINLIHIESKSEKEVVINRIEVYSDRINVLSGKGVREAGEKVGEVYKYVPILDGRPGQSYYKPKEIRLRQSGTKELLPLRPEFIEKKNQKDKEGKEVNIEVKIYLSIQMSELGWPRHFGDLELEPVSEKLTL